jgi:hypothetical protein
MLLTNIASKSLNIFKLNLSASSSSFSICILFMMLAIFLSGCTGMRDAIIDVPKTALATNQARIIINRIPSNKSKTDSLYSDFSARIFVNGKKLGAMAPGDVIFTDINQGITIIRVDNPAMPGKYSLSVNVKPNTEYKFHVSARAESNAPGKLFGIFDKGTYDKSNKNTGLFKIVEVFSKKSEKTPYVSTRKVAPKKKTVIKSKPISEPARNKPKQKLIIRSKKNIAPVKALPRQKSSSKLKISLPKAKPQVSPSQKRLIELKKLLDEELITKKDYEVKKRQILKKL